MMIIIFVRGRRLPHRVSHVLAGRARRLGTMGMSRSGKDRKRSVGTKHCASRKDPRERSGLDTWFRICPIGLGARIVSQVEVRPMPIFPSYMSHSGLLVVIIDDWQSGGKGNFAGQSALLGSLLHFSTLGGHFGDPGVPTRTPQRTPGELDLHFLRFSENFGLLLASTLWLFLCVFFVVRGSKAIWVPGSVFSDLGVFFL